VTRERESLKARLEWLRILGVDEMPARSAPSGTSRSPRPPDRSAEEGPAGPALQAGLFGGLPEAVDGASGATPRKTGRGGVPAASPLTSIRAPEAPDPAAALRLIREDLGECTRCGLCSKRTQIVFGVGSPAARVMFIGEGPGADEDLKGEPFVGRAGQLLTKIIESMGMRREDVYIANVVKCRPPENRTPLPDEIATCSPFLFQQVQAIRPRVIVCLGTPAAQTVLGTRDTITRLRGSFHDLDGIRVMPTFHPAYLLRNPAAKREVWDDMKKVIAELKADRTHS
jgi:uracil-DNA glycosylase family 4